MQLDVRLGEADRLALEKAVRKSPDWPARECAKTLLLLSQSLLSREVARLQDLNVETICVTWQRWVNEGMEALSDKSCSAAPRKLDPTAVEWLLQWAQEDPLSATEMLQRHIEAQGSPVGEHPDPSPQGQWYGVKMHELHFENKRDADAFAKSNQALGRLKRRAQAGEIELAYLGEAGFAHVHPNRSAWTPRSEQHPVE